MAWYIRDALCLAKSCPTSVPAWLQPQSYWQAVLEDMRVMVDRYRTSSPRLAAMFRAWPRQDVSACWQNAWQSAVLGMCVQAGFAQWQANFDWSIGKQIAMTNGASGWNRQWPAPYLVSFIEDATNYGANSFRWQPWDSDTSSDAYTATSWADAWQRFKIAPLPGQPFPKPLDDSAWDGHTLMTQFYEGSTYGAWPVYPLHTSTALAVAKALGTPEADACYTYLQTEIARAYANWGGTGTVYHGQARFSIEPTS